MKLIADSGSSKTAWVLTAPEIRGWSASSFTTSGINPVRDAESSVVAVLTTAQAAVGRALTAAGTGAVADAVTEVHFYGAGCLPSKIPMMTRLLSAAFPAAQVFVASDLLGAARALCGEAEGIACILGTGANSGLYDGHQVVANVPALGWILGDEGSGAVLGRTLVADVLKGQLPAPLCRAFLTEYALTAESVIEAVYRGPKPNRVLASFVPFLSAHRTEPAIRQLLDSAFRSFFRRNVQPYARPDLPVGFVGGVAAEFADELRLAAASEGFVVGRILQQPIQELVTYHE